MSSSSRPPSRGVASHRRAPHLLRWVGVICVVAVVAEVGWVTSGFGVAGLFHRGGGSGSSPPDLNPGNERVMGVFASLTWSGKGTNPFPSLAGGELCGPCPELPRVNDNVTPAVDGLWVYFNVTNSGTNSSQIRNFTVSTSGSDAGLFALDGEAAGDGLYCCYASHYGESIAGLLFGAGQTWGVAIFVYAASIPYDGSAGYTITLHLIGS
jgi:hypothetical protein